MHPNINPIKIEKIIIRYKGNSKIKKLSNSKNFGTKLNLIICELITPKHIKKNINNELMANLNIQINKHTLLI